MSNSETESPHIVRWFGVPARALILAGLALYAAGMLTYRAAFAVEEDEDYGRIVGRPYADVMFFLGTPDQVEPNGDRGLVLHYDEIRAVDGVFVRSHFRILVDNQSRTYAFERD